MKDLIYPQEWQDVEASIARLSDKQILFVCGAVKSGTTWTQLWLDRHPQIASDAMQAQAYDMDGRVSQER